MVSSDRNGPPLVNGESAQTTGGRPARMAVTEVGKQDIRFAVVMNGGVSLAVWISGVTLEVHHLALASRGRGRWGTYRDVLDLLDATARVDVISGTSAGGLNGAFLALGLAHNTDLALLRDLWVQHGALERLLRRPLDKNPPSLLQGDGYFLPRVKEALGQVLASGEVAQPTVPAGPRAEDTDPEPIELFLTGTLWEGRSSAFTDDMGVGITELDYDATFRFTNAPPPSTASFVSGDLRSTDAVVAELAEAARCTSSFPGAFEPHFVDVPSLNRGADDRWASTAGRANFGERQYVVDGGVLLNKPLRPALQAIYQQPAELQVRRVLAYVVPDPGEPLPSSRQGQSQTPP